MKLALFDLDNTLLAGDSDYHWNEFLIDKGIVDRASHDEANKRFDAEFLPRSGLIRNAWTYGKRDLFFPINWVLALLYVALVSWLGAKAIGK